MQFFPSCKQGPQQAKQIRACNVILDICPLENEFMFRAQAVISRFYYLITEFVNVNGFRPLILGGLNYLPLLV